MMPNEPLSKQVRRLKGKRIIDFKLNAWWESKDNTAMPQWVYDPAIYLEDGTVIRFMTQETEMGDYGVLPIVVRPRNGGC